MKGTLSVLQLMMESAIDVLMSTFKVYAGADGSFETLSRDEFGKLVKSELPNFLQVRMVGLPKGNSCSLGVCEDF